MAAAPAERKPNPNRLFVGNLSFQTTAETLGKLFEAQGEVEEALIVSRGQSSRGYGFVTMKTNADAQKALKALNNTELDGRNIRIEVSNSTGPHPAGQRPQRDGFRRRRRFGGFRRGGRFPRRRPPMRRTPKFNPNDPIVETRIHLGNLPYNLKDEQLKEEFKQFDIKEAIIIRGFNGRSHGYGFIECANADESKKILDQFPKKTIGGREVILSQARVKHERPQQQAPQTQA